GETLSGGQKQRIALARAAYSRSDIYLLDEPFSALDSKVAENVFEKVLGERGILRQKTRILVTNKGSFLRNVDQLLLVHNNQITCYPNATELIARHRHSMSNKTRMRHMTSSASSESSMGRSPAYKNINKLIYSILKLAKELTLDLLSFCSAVHIDYFSTICHLTSTLVILIVKECHLITTYTVHTGFTPAVTGIPWRPMNQKRNLRWMKSRHHLSTYVQRIFEGFGISFHTPNNPAAQNRRSGCFLVHLIFAVLFRSMGGLLLAFGSRKFSVHLHNEMLSHVLFSPVSFFDTNPRGRILNRFAVDLEAVDARLYLFGKQFIQAMLLTVAKLIAAGSQAPGIMIRRVLKLWFRFAQMLILRAANMTRFLETTRFSRTLQHVTESMKSLSTLRSYGVVERFCNHFCHLTDYHLKPYATFCAYYRVQPDSWKSLRLCSKLFLHVITLQMRKKGVSRSKGTFIQPQILQSIVSLNLVTFFTPQLLVSIERGLQYTELPEEYFKVKNEEHIDNNWPTNGRVEFENYCASYRPGVLSNVLKGITLFIEPCQKVGVVGRTGAGKSSLVLSLLRIIKTTSGEIRIDGIDIGTVPLRRLRSSITVIPQVRP
ncbi:ABC transporter, putative, partial [Ixodes scapularis]